MVACPAAGTPAPRGLGEGCSAEREEEGDPVDPGAGGDLDERHVIVLRVTKERPRLADEAAAQELGCNPKQRDQQASATGIWRPQQHRSTRGEDAERHPADDQVVGREGDHGQRK